jgi:hypothetical protein
MSSLQLASLCFDCCGHEAMGKLVPVCMLRLGCMSIKDLWLGRIRFSVRF